MLRSLKSILRFDVKATDGDAGQILDFFFDDDTWKVRYGVITAGTWPFGRKVLLSPISFRQIDLDQQAISISLSKEKVKNGPDIDTDMPVVPRQRMLLHGYYGWSAFLAGGSIPAPFVPAPIPEAEKAELDVMTEKADPHLRSAKEVIGYHLHASDGEIGHIDDFILDDEPWAITYLVVDTRNWLPGRKVLVSPHWAKEILWNLRRVTVDHVRESVRSSPAYDPTLPTNKEYEAWLHDHPGRMNVALHP